MDSASSRKQEKATELSELSVPASTSASKTKTTPGQAMVTPTKNKNRKRISSRSPVGSSPSDALFERDVEFPAEHVLNAQEAVDLAVAPVLTEVAKAVLEDEIAPSELKESIIRSASSSSLHNSIRHSPSPGWHSPSSDSRRGNSESPVLSMRRTSPGYSSPDSSLYSPTSPVFKKSSRYAVSEAGTTSPISVLSLPDMDDPRLVTGMFSSLPPSPNPHQVFFAGSEDEEEPFRQGRTLRRKSFLSYADIINSERKDEPTQPVLNIQELWKALPASEEDRKRQIEQDTQVTMRGRQ